MEELFFGMFQVPSKKERHQHKWVFWVTIIRAERTNGMTYQSFVSYFPINISQSFSIIVVSQGWYFPCKLQYSMDMDLGIGWSKNGGTTNSCCPANASCVPIVTMQLTIRANMVVQNNNRAQMHVTYILCQDLSQ